MRQSQPRLEGLAPFCETYKRVIGYVKRQITNIWKQLK